VSVKELDLVSENDYLKIIGPNPAESYLDAEFGIGSSTSNLEISLFDLQGNLLEKVVNDNYAQGVYRLSINTSKYTSGSYFLKFTKGGKSEIKSFVIIK
jgi:hypothetical protein